MRLPVRAGTGRDGPSGRTENSGKGINAVVRQKGAGQGVQTVDSKMGRPGILSKTTNAGCVQQGGDTPATWSAPSEAPFPTG